MNIKYYEFLNFLFDRDQAHGDWRFDFDEPQLSGEEVVFFINHMLDHYDEDLSKYSDWQLAMGLEYVFNNTFSNLSFYLRDGPAPIESRVNAILAFKNLFDKCLNKRCKTSLGHISEEGNELNSFCYMLWDVTPLTYCEEIRDKTKIYDAVLEVMEYSLYLSNKACVESGLHGLGHLELYTNKAPKIVRKFIESNPRIDSHLRKYAKNAENGYVQ